MPTNNETAWLSLKCTLIGGYGFGFVAAEALTLDFHDDAILMRANDGTIHEVKFVEIADFEVSGPGSVSRGGGFIGGGFGIDGAMVGIGLAAVLNSLTTRKSIQTFISIITNYGEIYLHFEGMEPGALRIALSRLFVNLRRLDKNWITSRQAILDSNRKTLTDETYQLALERLVNSAAITTLPDRKGRCPSCDTTLSLSADSCSRCGAQFGAGSAWSVQPF